MMVLIKHNFCVSRRCTSTSPYQASCKGVGLAQQSDLRTIHTGEFRLEVLADTHVADVPLAVDGTPVQVRHAAVVSVVPRALEVFA